MTSAEEAARLAAAFLTEFWQDTRPPWPAPAKDGFGQKVWRVTMKQAGRADGLDGVLTIDVDGREPYIAGVGFKPAEARWR